MFNLHRMKSSCVWPPEGSNLCRQTQLTFGSDLCHREWPRTRRLKSLLQVQSCAEAFNSSTAAWRRPTPVTVRICGPKNSTENGASRTTMAFTLPSASIRSARARSESATDFDADPLGIKVTTLIALQLLQDKRWRIVWDSNPRKVSLRRFSRPMPSTTQPTILWIWWMVQVTLLAGNLPADLQSAPALYGTTHPNLVLAIGFEPITYCLQDSCSAN